MNHNIVNLIVKKTEYEKEIDLLIKNCNDMDKYYIRDRIKNLKFFNKRLFRHMFDSAPLYEWNCDNEDLIRLSKYKAICYPELIKFDIQYKIGIEGKIDIDYFMSEALKSDNLDFIKFISVRTTLLIINELPEDYEKNSVLEALLDNLGPFYRITISNLCDVSHEISSKRDLERKIGKFLWM